MDAIKRFAAAWRFLTVLPFFWPAGDDEGECLRRSMPMFSVVGLILGATAAVFAFLAGHVFPTPALAALCVVLLALFSMGLHLDGLADCADALMSPGRSREKALAIMKDSRVGAHGALALALLLLLKYACLASLPHWELCLAVLAAPVAGRVAMLPVMVQLPYAREQGLGKVFAAANTAALFLGGGALLFVVFLAAMGWVGVWVGVVLWLAITQGWVLYLRHRLGGATGDCYGAACELGESAALLAAAAAYHLQNGL